MKKITRMQQSMAERFGSAHSSSNRDDAATAKDVELRRGGLAKLQNATQGYVRNMSKRKDADTAEGKLLPIDALGAVAIEHGDDFGRDSAYGQALVHFGTAQRQLARAQETYIERVNADFAESLDRSLATISDYTTERKKLEGRRLTYDALTTKVQKSKTEKAGLEEELRAAKVKYEESSVEVSRRAAAIQDGEMQQLRDLSAFVEAQMDYLTQCHDIVSELRSNWTDEDDVRHVPAARSKTPTSAARTRTLAPPVNRSRSNSRATSPTVSDDDRPSQPLSRSQSTSGKSRKAPPPLPRSRNTSRPASPIVSDDDDADENTTPVGRSFSQKVTGAASTVPTRARSGSGAIAGRVGALRKGNENGARSSYDSLNGDAPPPPPLRRSQTAPVSPVEIVEAKWDYEATADDELALSVGDQISVSRQINTEWSHGRNLRTGKQGMYPVSFVIPSTQAAAKPPPPALPTTRRPLVTTPARANTTAGDTSSPFDDDAGAKTNERDEAYGQSVSELRKRLFAGQ